MSELYIGLMSGTSLDGIDAGLVEFDDNKIKLIAFEYIPFSDSIKKSIHDLSQPDQPVLLKKYGAVDTQLGCLFAKATNNLLEKAKISSAEISAIGSHGQTIYHVPDMNSYHETEISSGFSLQIGDPNIIAEKTGITTIADFRRRDIAAGGQGAPLVPAFHQAIFSTLFDLSQQNVSIINIGGIANITYLSTNKATGFDIGPGNTLMDYWTQKNLNTSYDKSGNWAKSGIVNFDFVNDLKQDPYFKLIPPKSTGKEYFSSSWLSEKISHFPTCSAKDVQASLCQLIAVTVAEAIHQHAPLTDITLICGGGAYNTHLVDSIKNNLNHPVSSTAEYGINPDHVEAMAFAWLARQSMHNLPGNLTEVTGARTPVILGGVYPGNKT